MPGEGHRGVCLLSPPAVVVGHVVQHMAECRASTVVILPDVCENWFPRVSRATVRALVLP